MQEAPEAGDATCTGTPPGEVNVNVSKGFLNLSDLRTVPSSRNSRPEPITVTDSGILHFAPYSSCAAVMAAFF